MRAGGREATSCWLLRRKSLLLRGQRGSRTKVPIPLSGDLFRAVLNSMGGVFARVLKVDAPRSLSVYSEPIPLAAMMTY